MIWYICVNTACYLVLYYSITAICIMQVIFYYLDVSFCFYTNIVRCILFLGGKVFVYTKPCAERGKVRSRGAKRHRAQAGFGRRVGEDIPPEFMKY